MMFYGSPSLGSGDPKKELRDNLVRVVYNTSFSVHMSKPQTLQEVVAKLTSCEGIETVRVAKTLETHRSDAQDKTSTHYLDIMSSYGAMHGVVYERPDKLDFNLWTGSRLS